MAESDIIKNIVSTETGGAAKSILGEAPTLDTSLIRNLTPPRSLLLVILRVFFGLILLTGISSFLFFTSQLTSDLDFATSRLKVQNVSEDLASTNAEIISLQTDLNFYRYLQLNAFFDIFSSDGDSFLHYFEIANSQTSSEAEKENALIEISELKEPLATSISNIQQIFTEEFTAPLIDKAFSDGADLSALYKEKLIMKLNEKIASVSSNADSQARRDFKNLTQISDLVKNTGLRNLFLSIDFTALSDAEIYDFIKNVNSVIINDLTIIQKIKEQRIKWSDMIDEIALRTMTIDRHYNQNFYDDLGGIRYTSYNFDSKTKTISISGETKKFDTMNFTMIVDLVDELNKSKFFKDVAVRSLSKSGSVKDGYVSSVQLSLTLEDAEAGTQEEVSPNLTE
ncbi:MAG: hypothetical protein AAB540_01530 [Patescibacteria group bacterium]